MHHAKNKTIVLCLTDVVSYNCYINLLKNKTKFSSSKDFTTSKRTI